MQVIEERGGGKCNRYLSQQRVLRYYLLKSGGLGKDVEDVTTNARTTITKSLNTKHIIKIIIIITIMITMFQYIIIILTGLAQAMAGHPTEDMIHSNPVPNLRQSLLLLK